MAKKRGQPKGTRKYTAKDFIDAIPGTGGIIKDIAANVGCGRGTALRYIREYVSIAAAVEDEKERVKDYAESVIVKDITDNKDVGTAKWFLGVFGADRGYGPQTTRHEITGADGGPVETKANIVPDLSSLTDAELEALLVITGKLEESGDQGKGAP